MLKWIISAVVCLVVIFFVAAFTVDGKREERIAIFLNHLEGVNGVPYKDGISVRVQPERQCLQLEHNKNEILLSFKQIEQVNIITWEKTITKALNPMAEGIVGGILGGSTMAVVSAIDAKGRTRTEKVKVPHALEIQYYPKGENQTLKRLVFGEVASQGMILQFAKTLCHYANLPEPQYIQQEKKGPTYL